MGIEAGAMATMAGVALLPPGYHAPWFWKEKQLITGSGVSLILNRIGGWIR